MSAPENYTATAGFTVEAVQWDGDNFKEIFKHYNKRNPETFEIDDKIWMDSLNTYEGLDVNNEDGKTIRVRKGNYLVRFENGWFTEFPAEIFEKHFPRTKAA